MTDKSHTITEAERQKYLRARPSAKRQNRYDSKAQRIIQYWVPRLAGQYVGIKGEKSPPLYDTEAEAIDAARRFQDCVRGMVAGIKP